MTHISIGLWQANVHISSAVRMHHIDVSPSPALRVVLFILVVFVYAPGSDTCGRTAGGLQPDELSPSSRTTTTSALRSFCMPTTCPVILRAECPGRCTLVSSLRLKVFRQRPPRLSRIEWVGVSLLVWRSREGTDIVVRAGYSGIGSSLRGQ